VANLVDALRCKTEGRWLDYRWDNFDFSLTYSFRLPCESGVDSVSEKESTKHVFLRANATGAWE